MPGPTTDQGGAHLAECAADAIRDPELSALASVAQRSGGVILRLPPMAEALRCGLPRSAAARSQAGEIVRLGWPVSCGLAV